MPLSISLHLFRNMVGGRRGRRSSCLPVWLFKGWEDGGDDCHQWFDWSQALRLGLLCPAQQMFHRQKMGVSNPVSEPADGKLKLFAPVMLHLHSHVVAT